MTLEMPSAFSLIFEGSSMPLAGNAERVHLFSVKAVLGEQLVKAVCIAGLQEHKHLAVALAALFYEILREVCSAEIVPDKVLVDLLRRSEQTRGLHHSQTRRSSIRGHGRPCRAERSSFAFSTRISRFSSCIANPPISCFRRGMRPFRQNRSLLRRTLRPRRR